MLFTTAGADTPHGEFTLHSSCMRCRTSAAVRRNSDGFSAVRLLQLHGPRTSPSCAPEERFAVHRAGALVDAAEPPRSLRAARTAGPLRQRLIVPPQPAGAPQSPVTRPLRAARRRRLTCDESGWQVQSTAGARCRTAVIVATAAATTAGPGRCPSPRGQIPLPRRRSRGAALRAARRLTCARPRRVALLRRQLPWRGGRLRADGRGSTTQPATPPRDPAALRSGNVDGATLAGPWLSRQHTDRLPWRPGARHRRVPHTFPACSQCAPAIEPVGPYRRLYFSAGHGSRGLTSAPLCAEAIAAAIAASPRPARRLQRTCRRPLPGARIVRGHCHEREFPPRLRLAALWCWRPAAGACGEAGTRADPSPIPETAVTVETTPGARPTLFTAGHPFAGDLLVESGGGYRNRLVLAASQPRALRTVDLPRRWFAEAIRRTPDGCLC